ncbi:hypothetical protein D3C86_1467880 [compost metagenome]
MSSGCMARTQRAPSRAQIFRGNSSSAGKPIWNGRIDCGRKPIDEVAVSGAGGATVAGVRGLRPGVTMVPAWPRAWI